MIGSCLNCAETYYASTLRQLYCSINCGKAYRRWLETPPPDLTKVCAYTGCDNGMAHRRRDALFCSRLCLDRDRRERLRLARPKSWKPKRRGRSEPRPGTRGYAPGDQWHELTLLAYAGRSQSGDTLATFDCTCGATVTKRLGNVVQGATRSCGRRSSHRI